MSLYTSREEFDLEKRVHMTNEIPPYDMYDALNISLQNELWQWVLGYTRVVFDMPYAVRELLDDGTTTFTHDPMNGEVYYKMVNGEFSENYGPVGTLDADGTSLTYPIIEEYGVVLPEFDFLLHEVYRYLDSLYPDHPDYIELLTNNEFNDMITNTGAMIDYTPDNAFFEKVASSLGLSSSEQELEAAMIKIRNLRNEAFRRKLYGSKAGYRMFAGDVYQNVTVFPVATYLPIKPITRGQIYDEYVDYSSPYYDITALREWNQKNEKKYTRDNYFDYIRTYKRDIDTYSPLYYNKFRLIDFDGSKSAYPAPRDDSTYFSAYALPFNEYSLFEYPVGSDVDSIMVSVESGMVDDTNEAKDTNYIAEVNADIPLIKPSDISITSSRINFSGYQYFMEESMTEEIHSFTTSLKNAVNYQRLYHYPRFIDIDYESGDFDLWDSVHTVYTGDTLPLSDMGISNPFGKLFRSDGSNGFLPSRMSKIVSSYDFIYNPRVKDTLLLRPDEVVKFYPDEVGVYYDTSASGGGYFFTETPVIWGEEGNGLTKYSYLSNVYQNNSTNSTATLEEGNILQIVGFTKGHVGFVNNTSSSYRLPMHDTVKTLDSSVGKDRYAFVVENEKGNMVILEGSLSVENFPEQSRTVTLDNEDVEIAFGGDGVTVYETKEGNGYCAKYIELQVTAIPSKKSSHLMALLYGDAYNELQSDVKDADGEYVSVIPRVKKEIDLCLEVVKKYYDEEAYNEAVEKLNEWLNDPKNAEYKLYPYGNVDGDEFPYYILEHYYADDQYINQNGKRRNLGEEAYLLAKDILDTFGEYPSEVLMGQIKSLKEAKEACDKMKENRGFLYEKLYYETEDGEEKESSTSLVQPGCNVIKVLEGNVSYDPDTYTASVAYTEMDELGYGAIADITLGHLNVMSLFDMKDGEMSSPANENGMVENEKLYLRRIKNQVTSHYEFSSSESSIDTLIGNFMGNVNMFIQGMKPISTWEENDVMEKSSSEFVDSYTSIISKDGEYKNKENSYYALYNGSYVEVESSRRYSFDEVSRQYLSDAKGLYVKIKNGLYIEAPVIYNRINIYRNISYDFNSMTVSFDHVVQNGVETLNVNFLSVKKKMVLPMQYSVTVSEPYLENNPRVVIDLQEVLSNVASGNFPNLMTFTPNSSYIIGEDGNHIRVTLEKISGKDRYILCVYYYDHLVLRKTGVHVDEVYTVNYLRDEEDGEMGDGYTASSEMIYPNPYVVMKWSGQLLSENDTTLSGAYFYDDVYLDYVYDRQENFYIIQRRRDPDLEYRFDYNSYLPSIMGEGIRDFTAGNYLEDSPNIRVYDTERTEIKIECVINIGEGSENKIFFESDMAREMMKCISVGDKVYGPSLDTDDNDIYVISVGDNEVTVSQNLQQSGTFILTFYVKLMIYPDDITDELSTYKSVLYENGLYEIMNPYAHGLWGSDSYPYISNVLLDSLPDISFFDMTPSSEYGSLNVPSMNPNGDTSFQWILKETHWDDYEKYIEALRDLPDMKNRERYKLIPSDVKFNNELFVEVNLNKLLKYESREGDNPILMSVDWLDYMENNLFRTSRATDKVSIGTNLILQTDTSGFYTWITGQSYTDPVIRSRFMTMNLGKSPMWNDSTILDDDWTVPAYAQIGMGGNGRKRLFRNPNDVTYPNIYGVSVYNDHIPVNEYDENSTFYQENGELRTMAVYADKGFPVGAAAENSVDEVYDSVEEPLFEMPLGEYNTVIKYAPSNMDNAEELLGTITQVSFHEQTFQDITRYFDDTEGMAIIQNDNAESYSILRLMAYTNECFAEHDEGVINFSYGGTWSPSLIKDDDGEWVVDYSEMKEGFYYFVLESGNYSELKEGERTSFEKGEIIFVYSENGSIVYDLRKFQFVCPVGDKYNTIGEDNEENDKVSPLNFPIYDSEGNSYYVTWDVGEASANPLNKYPVDVFTRLVQYYFRTTGNFTSNQVEAEVNQSTLARLMSLYGNMHSRYKKLEEYILYYAYVGGENGSERFFGSDYKDIISEGDRVALAYVKGRFYFFRLTMTSMYGVALPVTALGGGVLESELLLMNGEDSETSSVSTMGLMKTFNSSLTLPHGYITPGSYEFNFTIDPHFTTYGYLYEDDGMTLDKTKDIVQFCITRGAIYYDDENDEFYCYSYIWDPSSLTFGTEVKKVAILFNDNMFFKNVLNMNCVYQVRNTIEMGSNEVKSTPTLTCIGGVDFPIDKLASNDRILGVKLINLRSIYNRALEPTFFSSFAKLNYRIYGFDTGKMILAPAPDSTGAGKSKFIMGVTDLFPTVVSYDELSNIVSQRHATSGDGYDFLDEDTLNLVLADDQISLYSVGITRSPLQDTYVSSSDISSSKYEFKYFKNNLVFRAAVNRAFPNVLITPSTDASLFFSAVSQIGTGDIVKGGMALTNLSEENKFSVDVVDTEGDGILIKKLCYADSHILILSMSGEMYYNNDVDLESLSSTIVCKKSLVTFVNGALPQDVSYDYEYDAWMVEAGDSDSTDMYMVPVTMLGEENQEPYSSVYSSNSRVYITQGSKTLFVGGTVGATWDSTDTHENLEEASEEYYVDLDTIGVIKEFTSSVEFSNTLGANTNVEGYGTQDVLYRDIALSYGSLTEASYNHDEKYLVLTVNPVTDYDVDPLVVDGEKLSFLNTSKDIISEPYYIDSLKVSTAAGALLPVSSTNTSSVRAVHASSTSQRYAFYAKGRDAFIKAPVALVEPNKDANDEYDYTLGFNYNGKLSSDSYWKRVRIPTMDNKLYYNILRMVSVDPATTYEALEADAKYFYLRLGLFKNVYTNESSGSVYTNGADNSKQSANFDSLFNLGYVQVSDTTGFRNIRLTDSDKEMISSIVDNIGSKLGFSRVIPLSDTNMFAGDLSQVELASGLSKPYLAEYEDLRDAMDSAKNSPGTWISVSGTNDLLEVSYNSDLYTWTISIHLFSLQNKIIKDIEGASYIGSSYYTIPLVVGNNLSTEYKLLDDDVIPPYNEAYAWYVFYIDYYLFGNAEYSSFVLTSNISSALFTSSQLLLTDELGGISSINLMHLTKREDVENPENWRVSSLPPEYYFFKKDTSLSGGFYLFYDKGGGETKFLKISRKDGAYHAPVVKILCTYFNDGVMLLGGYIYSKDNIETMFMEQYMGSTLSLGEKEALKNLKNLSPYESLCHPIAFYSVDGGISFQEIPLSSLNLSERDSRVGKKTVKPCISSIRYVNEEYQFIVADADDVADSTIIIPKVFSYYYRVCKTSEGVYNFGSTAESLNNGTGVEFADKDEETLQMGNAMEFDVDASTGVNDEVDASSKESSSTSAVSPGMVRFFITPNKTSFYVATLTGLNVSGEVTVSSVSSTSVTLSQNLLEKGSGKVDIFLSVYTSSDIPDQSIYINYDNIDSYVSPRTSSFKVPEVTEVKNSSNANRFFSYRELVTDVNDTNGYPAQDEDEERVYYNYNKLTLLSGELYYEPKVLINDNGNIVKLCSSDGLQYLRMSEWGNEMSTAALRESQTIDDFRNACEVKYESLSDLDYLNNVGLDSVDVPVYEDTLLSQYINMENGQMRITQLSKGVGTPRIVLSCSLNSSTGDTHNFIDAFDISDGILYYSDSCSSTQNFALYLVKMTGELTQEQYNACMAYASESDRLEKFTEMIQRIYQPTTTNENKYRYVPQTTSGGKHVWYDAYYEVYPISQRRNLVAYADMPYYFPGMVGYKGINYSDIANDANHPPIAGMYISQYGYGGTRNNTDENWSTLLPWKLDPEAFIRTSDISGTISEDELYMKNSLGWYVYLTNNKGEKIYSKNSEKVMTVGDEFQVSLNDFSDDSSVQTVSIIDQNDSTYSVDIHKIEKAQAKTYVAMSNVLLGAEAFDLTFYLYKSGMLVSHLIKDPKIYFVYSDSGVTTEADASEYFDLSMLKQNILRFNGTMSFTEEFPITWFSTQYSISGLSSLKLKFTYNGATYTHIIDAQMSDSGSSTSVIMSRPLFYMESKDSSRKGQYDLVPYLFSYSDMEDAEESPLDPSTLSSIKGYVKPGHFSEKSLVITMTELSEALTCFNSSLFYSWVGLPVKMEEGVTYTKGSTTISISFNDQPVTSLDVPTVNLASVSSNVSLYSINLPIFELGEVYAFAIIGLNDEEHNYWLDQVIDTSVKMYIDENIVHLGDDVIMEVNKEDNILEFGLCNPDFVGIETSESRMSLLMKTVEMEVDSSYYSMEGKRVTVRELIDADEDGRFRIVSAYDELHLSIVPNYRYRICFPIYIVDRFQGTYLNSLNISIGTIGEWEIRYKMADGSQYPLKETSTSHTYFYYDAPNLRSVDGKDLYELKEVVALELYIAYDALETSFEIPIRWGFMASPEVTDMDLIVCYNGIPIKVTPERNMVLIDHEGGISSSGRNESMNITTVYYDLPGYTASSEDSSLSRIAVAQQLETLAEEVTVKELHDKLIDVLFDNIFVDSTQRYSLSRYLRGEHFVDSSSLSYTQRALYTMASLIGEVLGNENITSSIVGHISYKISSVDMYTQYDDFKEFLDAEYKEFSILRSGIMNEISSVKGVASSSGMYEKLKRVLTYTIPLASETGDLNIFKDFDSFLSRDSSGYLTSSLTVDSQPSSGNTLEKIYNTQLDIVNEKVKSVQSHISSIQNALGYYIEDSYTASMEKMFSEYTIGYEYSKLFSLVYGMKGNTGEISSMYKYIQSVSLDFTTQKLLIAAYMYRQCYNITRDVEEDGEFYYRVYSGDVYVFTKNGYYHTPIDAFNTWLKSLEKVSECSVGYGNYTVAVGDSSDTFYRFIDGKEFSNFRVEGYKVEIDESTRMMIKLSSSSISFSSFVSMHDDYEEIRSTLASYYYPINEYTSDVLNFIREHTEEDMAHSSSWYAFTYLVEGACVNGGTFSNRLEDISTEPLGVINVMEDSQVKFLMEALNEEFSKLIVYKRAVENSQYGDYMYYVNSDTKLRDFFYTGFYNLWNKQDAKGTWYEEAYVEMPDRELGGFPFTLSPSDEVVYHLELNSMLQSLGYSYSGTLTSPLTVISYTGGNYSEMASKDDVFIPEVSVLAMNAREELMNISYPLRDKMYWMYKLYNGLFTVDVLEDDVVSFTEQYPEYSDSMGYMNTYRLRLEEKNLIDSQYASYLNDVNEYISDIKKHNTSIGNNFYLPDSYTSTVKEAFDSYILPSEYYGVTSLIEKISSNGQTGTVVIIDSPKEREDISKKLLRIGKHYLAMKDFMDSLTSGNNVLKYTIDGDQAYIYTSSGYYHMDYEKFVQWLDDLKEKSAKFRCYGYTVEHEGDDDILFDNESFINSPYSVLIGDMGFGYYGYTVEYESSCKGYLEGGDFNSNDYTTTMGNVGIYVLSDDISLDGFTSMYEDIEEVREDLNLLVYSSNEYTEEIVNYYNSHSSKVSQEDDVKDLSQIVDRYMDWNYSEKWWEFDSDTLSYGSIIFRAQIEDEELNLMLMELMGMYDTLSSLKVSKDEATRQYNIAQNALVNPEHGVVDSIIRDYASLIKNVEDISAMRDVQNILIRAKAIVISDDEAYILSKDDEMFNVYDTSSLASLVINVVNGENTIYSVVSDESILWIISHYCYNMKGVIYLFSDFSASGAYASYTQYYISYFKLMLDEWFGSNEVIKNYRDLYMEMMYYIETVYRVMYEYYQDTKLQDYVSNLEKAFYDYVVYFDEDDNATVARSVKMLIFDRLRDQLDAWDNAINSKRGRELTPYPQDGDTWYDYAQYRFLKMVRNIVNTWKIRTDVDSILYQKDYLDVNEGRLLVYESNPNGSLVVMTPNPIKEGTVTFKEWSYEYPTKYVERQYKQGLYLQTNALVDTTMNVGYYSLLSVENDDAYVKNLDNTLYPYYNTVLCPYKPFSYLFWEYDDGKNILPSLSVNCDYMLTFVGERDANGNITYLPPVIITKGGEAVGTEAITLKVSRLTVGVPSNVLVTGISDFVKVRKMTYENMYRLIQDLGYIIDNDDGVLAESKDSLGYTSEALDNLSFNIVDKEINLASLTEFITNNYDVKKNSQSKGVSLDDGYRHYVQIRVLTHSTVEMDISKAQKKKEYSRLELSDIDDFTPDRIYFHPDGYPGPSFRLGNVVFNEENIDKYENSMYRNNNLNKVYRCNSDGQLIGYKLRTGTVAAKFDRNDSSCAGYLVGEDGSTLTHVAEMFTLDSKRHSLNNAIVPYEPSYKTCKEWYKNTYYLKGKESNPYWQSLKIDSKFDKASRSWKQRTRVVQYIRSSATMVEQEVDEELQYVNVSSAIKAQLASLSVDILYDSDFVDLNMGQVNFFMRVPNLTYRDTKNFVKYGITAFNSFYKSSTSSYKNIWSGNNQPLSGNVSSTYTINSFRNLADKTDKDQAIRQVTELGLFNKKHEMIAYATFPPIEYRTDTQHISFTCFIKMGKCRV